MTLDLVTPKYRLNIEESFPFRHHIIHDYRLGKFHPVVGFIHVVPRFNH